MRGTVGTLHSFPNFHSGTIDASGPVRSIRWESPPCAGRCFTFFILERGASALNVEKVLYEHGAGVMIFTSETLHHILIEEHILTPTPDKEPEPMAPIYPDPVTTDALSLIDAELESLAEQYKEAKAAAVEADTLGQELYSRLDSMQAIRDALAKEQAE